MITSAGNRNPANAEVGGSQREERIDDFTVQVCLDHAYAQRNRAGGTPVLATEATAGLNGRSP